MTGCAADPVRPGAGITGIIDWCAADPVRAGAGIMTGIMIGAPPTRSRPEAALPPCGRTGFVVG